MGEVDKLSKGKYTKQVREGLKTNRRRAQEQQREMEKALPLYNLFKQKCKWMMVTLIV